MCYYSVSPYHNAKNIFDLTKTKEVTLMVSVVIEKELQLHQIMLASK